MVVLVVGLVLWFFVNRASSRANEQIELLEALLDQQKRQNALLRRCEANEPEKAEPATAASEQKRMRTSFVWFARTICLPGHKWRQCHTPLFPRRISPRCRLQLILRNALHNIWLYMQHSFICITKGHMAFLADTAHYIKSETFLSLCYGLSLFCSLF